ncbi:MAG: hypothetical protein E6J13_01175 [Chloroflexi bacterium]|nr:MAG: hypothetical protein E6J13_01175 [Chloroflexota bacterium]
MGPFDRFNDRAKRVLALAQDEAIRFNHNYIGVEHLLLGLVREGEGVAARVLNSLGVELSKARTAVEFIIGRGDSTTRPNEITLSPRTKKVIELAVDEARKLGHSYVGTEHILLGVAREGQGVASGVLESLGVSVDNIRQQVVEVMGLHGSDTLSSAGRSTPTDATLIATSYPTAPVDRFDAAGRRALARAYWEAGRANEPEVSGHHLLLALIANDEIWIRKALTQLGIDLADLTSRIDAAAPPRPGPRAPTVNDGSAALIRMEHLLLALSQCDGIAATALNSVGASPKRIREILDRMSG